MYFLSSGVKELTECWFVVGVAQEHFHRCGGPNFLLSLMKESDDDKLKQACLFTLATAVDKHGMLTSSYHRIFTGFQ